VLAAGAVVLVAAADPVVAVGLVVVVSPQDARSIVEIAIVAKNVARFRLITSSFGSCPFRLQ
jgi:hypothetical protein